MTSGSESYPSALNQRIVALFIDYFRLRPVLRVREQVRPWQGARAYSPRGRFRSPAAEPCAD
eukprot:11155028-Lingulodinium_polyedra.AAC.1